jgi:hypothetical protein
MFLNRGVQAWMTGGFRREEEEEEPGPVGFLNRYAHFHARVWGGVNSFKTGTCACFHC